MAFKTLQNTIESLLKKDSPFLYLATISKDQKPSVRCIVFRYFGINSLLFVTDIRSQKVNHILSNQHAEIAWYFYNQRIQLRIPCVCSLLVSPNHSLGNSNSKAVVIDEEIRLKLWNEISPSTRAQYSWPNPMPNNESSESKVYKDTLLIGDAECAEALNNFVVLVAKPTEYEYLDLNVSPLMPITSTL
ncbi:hypothetical protein BC833DRAFT_587473 [Globomyces pollinis-pini]|nr:hypothetical protein BC833DRAFT_587473 [Globomyces pollinis-pini]